MPISDPEIPVTFLKMLTEAQIPFLVLHGENRIGTSDLSTDLDLVVGLSPTAVLNRVRENLSEAGLLTVIIWPYDLGGTCGVFVASQKSAAGAQIDLLFDPRGLGRYGIRSQALLERGEVRENLPVPAPLDRELYLLRKATCKGKKAESKESVFRLTESGQVDAARVRIPTLFSRVTARDLLRQLDPNNLWIAGFPIRPIRTLANLERIVRRVLNPSGFWVELVSSDDLVVDVASDLEDGFSGWLLRVAKGPRPTRTIAIAQWWMTRVLPTKIRAGMFISWAPTTRWPLPDLTIPVRSPVDRWALQRQIIETMAKLASP